MIPLTVRAHLATGVAMNSWGISLDGLLASLIWADLKADARDAGAPLPAFTDITNPPDLDLPLARCDLAGPNLWHWATTNTWIEPPTSSVDVRHWTARADHRHLEQVAKALPKVISNRQGRYQVRRMPLIVITCSAVSWRAVGDPEKISSLLENVPTIGKKRTSGEGQVVRWEVTPQGDLDFFAAAHQHPDGALGRPCPSECLTGRGIVPDSMGRTGLRPPYLHDSRQHALNLPCPIS